MPKTSTSINFKDNLRQFWNLIINIFPQNKHELYLLLFCILGYFAYGIILTLNTCIQDSITYSDIYFSYDNMSIYHLGYQNMTGHPLIRRITYPLLYWTNYLATEFGNYKIKTILFCLSSNLLISLSVVYIFRYLKQIIKLKGYPLYAITLFYIFSATNLILSFTFESFSLSLFALCFTIYYYSYCIDQNKQVTFLTNFSLATLLGGITITNLAKGVIPMFFTKEKFKISFLKSTIIGIIWLFILLWVNYKYQIVDNMGERLNDFTGLSDSFIKHAFGLFWGGAILFPRIIYSMKYSADMNIGNIIPDYYDAWQYVFVGIIAILVLGSIALNYKNKLVQILCAWFAIDIIIHIGIKYGLEEPFMYGAHWIFIVPILIGWLLNSIKSEKHSKLFMVFFSVILLTLIVNNMIELVRFINLAIELFPPHIL